MRQVAEITTSLKSVCSGFNIQIIHNYRVSVRVGALEGEGCGWGRDWEVLEVCKKCHSASWMCVFYCGIVCVRVCVDSKNNGEFSLFSKFHASLASLRSS